MLTVCSTIFHAGLCGFHFSQPLTLLLSTAIFVNTGEVHTERVIQYLTLVQCHSHENGIL